MSIKQILKKMAMLLPGHTYRNIRDFYRALKDEVSLAGCMWRDWQTFRKNSGLFRLAHPEVLQAKIIKNYHRIEKGLALPSPRPGFGADAIANVLNDVRLHIDSFGVSDVTRNAVNTLLEYLKFNSLHGNISIELKSTVEALLKKHDEAGIRNSDGGTKQIRRSEIHEAAKHDMSGFFASRHSVRCFAPIPVQMELITNAVKMAQKAPSVCNRESGKVWVIDDKQLQERLLALQNGNRGFGDQADKILVVGSSLDCFLTVGERNQAWIDGGMFAMSLVYALHSLGLGVCCLNWSVKSDADLLFKREAGLPGNIAVIMLLAVGHLPEQCLVARSVRKPIDQVFGMITPGKDGRGHASLTALIQ